MRAMPLEVSEKPGAGRVSAPTSWRAPGRVALALAALAALALAAAEVTSRERDLAGLVRRGRALGLEAGPGTELGRALAREADAGERRLALARAALGAAARARTRAEADLAPARLAAARELAAEALALLPASAEAPRLLGVAVALDRRLGRDSRLLTEPGAWERPLELARARASGAEPAGLALAAVYLELWPGLSGERRERAAQALRTAFADPEFSRAAFARWLEVAGSIPRAGELLPDVPESWDRLARAALAAGDLGTAAGLHQRSRSALERELEAALERAIAAGAQRGPALDEALLAAPADRRFAPWLARALAARPPGPAGPALAAAASRWLAWARPLCLGPGCPLPPETLERLAGAAAGAAPYETIAFALLAAGDRAGAERLARRADALWSEGWAPYLLLTARRRLEAGDTPGAREALRLAHRSAFLRSPGRELARAAGAASAARETPTAAPGWQPSEWVWERGVPALTLEAGRDAAALRLAFTRPLARPTLLLVEWDGGALPALPLALGAVEARLPVEAGRGAHLLRLSLLAGEMPALGVTTLE
jgi:hypothetical protein